MKVKGNTELRYGDTLIFFVFDRAVYGSCLSTEACWDINAHHCVSALLERSRIPAFARLMNFRYNRSISINRRFYMVSRIPCRWLQYRFNLCGFLILVPFFVHPAAAQNFTCGAETAREFGIHEIVLTGRADVSNPFETDCVVTFEPDLSKENAVRVKAFYDGKNIWRARLYVSKSGRWSWRSHSDNDLSLNGKAGTFMATASNLRGKLRSHSANRRQWCTDDGQTFLNLSDTGYILFRSPNHPKQPVSDSIFRDYVRDLVPLGITSIRTGGCGGYAGWNRLVRSSLSPDYDRSNWCWEKPYDASGVNRYWERFDLDRFQTTDRRLRWLLNNYPDMYIQLIMLSKEGKKWFEIPDAFRKRTIEYMVARWSAWPQIFYQIVNDTQFTDKPENLAFVREVGRYMARIEPFGTLVGAGAKRYEDNPFTLRSDWETWHTYLHIEKYAEVDAAVCDYYYQEGGYDVPVHLFYGEDWYEQYTDYDVGAFAEPDYYYRRLFWSFLLSGGSPNYGGRAVVLHPYSQTGSISFTTRRLRYNNEPLKGLDSVIHIKRFFEDKNIDLALFSPADNMAQALPAPKPEPNGPSRAQCAHREQDEYLIYLPCAMDGELSGGDNRSKQQKSRSQARLNIDKTPGVRIDLRDARGAFEVCWYRVSDGVVQSVPSLQGGDYVTLTSPWRGTDVVLHLTKQKKYRPARVGIIPHRGGRDEYPENTMYAYEHNLRDGVSLDADIRKTGDGDIVVIHDERTGRTCDKDWVVAEKTVAQLKTLDAAYRFDPKRDGTFPFRGRGIQIPTLHELLAKFVSERR
jgi:hypothetical protein